MSRTAARIASCCWVRSSCWTVAIAGASLRVPGHRECTGWPWTEVHVYHRVWPRHTGADGPAGDWDPVAERPTNVAVGFNPRTRLEIRETVARDLYSRIVELDEGTLRTVAEVLEL